MSVPLPMRRLAPGDRVHVIAPSSPFSTEDFERGIARLRERFDVRFDANILAREGYFAGSDQRRAAELLAAMQDRSVQGIIAARGGYGATRLLDRIDPLHLARHPKLLVGFSDASALHAVWALAGLGSLHASMVAAMGRASDALVQRWLGALCGAEPPPLRGLETVAPGRARGVLRGGNLAVLTALIGTPYLPPTKGCVLFFEDVGERPYRVDRMLTQWLHAGLLKDAAAILLGTFTACGPGPDGISVEDVLRERLGSLGIPVLAGVPAGHVDDNLELPLGAMCEVDAAGGLVSIETQPV